jgi:hypothetical protein
MNNIDSSNYVEVLKAWSTEYNIHLLFNDSLPYYKNSSTFTSKKGFSGEITIGHYEDWECLVISFFYELGHSVNKGRNYPTMYEFELDAWVKGLLIAYKKGLEFSSNAKQYALNCLLSYLWYEERECKETKPKSIYYVKYLWYELDKSVKNYEVQAHR